jgi:hypothetical protein
VSFTPAPLPPLMLCVCCRCARQSTHFKLRRELGEEQQRLERQRQQDERHHREQQRRQQR